MYTHKTNKFVMLMIPIMIRPLDKAGRLRNPSEQIFNSSRCTKKVLQLKYGYIEIRYQLLSVEKLVDNSWNLG